VNGSQNRGGYGPVDVIDARCDHGIRASQRREAPRHAQRHVHRFDAARLAADADLVRHPSVLRPGKAEDFAGGRKVAQDDAVKRDDSNEVWSRALYRRAWRESCDHRLFSH
jgi:hypothetical protein